MSDRGKKILEFEELLVDSGKKALDYIFKDCPFCLDKKTITTEFVNSGGYTVIEEKPCPRCYKDKK